MNLQGSNTRTAAALATAWLVAQMSACIQPRESANLDPSVLLPITGQDAGAAHRDGATPSRPPAGGDGDGDTSFGGDGDIAPPPGGDAGAPANPLVPDAGSSGPTNGSHPSTLTFSVLTESLGGRYAPFNIGAIWIENSSGTWIKTLALWAATRERYLSTFNNASGGNKVDAVTSATLWWHQTHTVTWDLKDVNGNAVPDGEYQVWIETTDSDSAGDSASFAFTKGTEPVHSTPPDKAHYTQIKMDYQ
jgi:hypothetical protein